MEATRPTPVDLTRFQPGQERNSVVEQLGIPITTEVQADGDSCDLYELFLTGHGSIRKATMFVEGATDVVMPAAELLWSPTQAVTRDKKHPVWFCYENQKDSQRRPETLQKRQFNSKPDPNLRCVTSPTPQDTYPTADALNCSTDLNSKECHEPMAQRLAPRQAWRRNR
jgi:hypothetical protein